MKVMLKQIAGVQVGHTFRRRLEVDPLGNVSVVQMKDLTDDNTVDESHLAQVCLDQINKSHLLAPGDLILRSRSRVNTAVLVEARFDCAIVAAPLLRVRLLSSAVLPAYLCWFINGPVSQAYLKSRATGSGTRIIGISVLEELEIVVPALAVQRRIIELAKLMTIEQQLLKSMACKRKRYMETLLMQLASQ